MSYFVLLDANVWIAERLLQSSLGNAFLYALTGAKSSILLPEVVELEVAGVLPNLAERAVEIIGREAALLRQLSGHTMQWTVPSAAAVEKGIRERLKQLDGLLTRVPFSHDQARYALNRVIAKELPSGDNNEQFRDCCMWHAALSTTTDQVVYLITADFGILREPQPGIGIGPRAAPRIKEYEEGAAHLQWIEGFSGYNRSRIGFDRRRDDRKSHP